MPSLKLTAPSRQIKGHYTPPGDKSISHRAVMFGALAKGKSRFKGFLKSEDCVHTMRAFSQMGVEICLETEGGTITLSGVGLKGLSAPRDEIYLGNSGTSMRLLLGVLAGQSFEAVLTGDASLSSRPMKRVTGPLKQMGAQIKGPENANFAPLKIRGGRLRGIEYENKVHSAQVKSALLLAGLYAEGVTRVRESVRSRDHTERLLAAMGASFRRDGEWVEVTRTEALAPLDGRIPGDISSAAFFLAGAAMSPGAELTVEGVCLNPTRTGILNVLQRMGASIEVRQEVAEPEPVGTIYVRGARLRGTRITKQEIPGLIDELPVLMTVMALAEGESLISGAEELRVKETDRIASMVQNLNSVGGRLEELPDGCVVQGVDSFRSGRVMAYGDHRTVMSLVMASLAVKEGDFIEIDDTASVATSYPDFFQDFECLLKN